ncbi:tRNA preQ1(34) S-adenosylmethionine ribosyltransferase-isomerase QueA [Desulfovibrio gilichinskyi]|uniref:S-adenosylmethionine:tRNA ribosyltransferase-isomerase n=1 Tax=Desulfovibrio gilichinskyi TaxID=1519643 RepID=A0A1X7DZZ0_9BACT|nr:tRNA preQ1(34) S-adenosylmethionine ribosyltransferase-isomerase QueA [Desulfovibrio gilichinskyi]SMF24908.1 S-adenosylmethionine--tRNA ribosyltransferase-isomerase [Desulfovibrio gilichinskyi]
MKTEKMKTIPKDLNLKSYDFELPEDRIAQCPTEKRHGSKLMVLDKVTGGTELKSFTDVPDILPEGALLVANNSKVIPARIFGKKPSGGRVEFLLLTPVPLIEPTVTPEGNKAIVKGLLRSSKPTKTGSEVIFDCEMNLTVLGKGQFGLSEVELKWKGNLKEIFETYGKIPLPPYIRRAADENDTTRYQTLYACDDKAGSVAAPTAGLHFSKEIEDRLREKNIEKAEVTLYVGYGTFSPVRTTDIREHEMHNEYIEIPETTARAIQKAKDEGRPVIAVGTTSARTLEGAFQQTGKICEFKGETNIFIYPGYEFKVVDRMITNFHLPESSLVIMISALAGRDNVLNAYQKAIENKFRFFSYGDSMYIK